MAALLVPPIDAVLACDRLQVADQPISQSSWVRRIEARSLPAAFMRHDTTGEISGAALSGRESAAARELYAGTPSCMNPEQWREDRSIAPASAGSDLFALGVTL